MTASRLMVVLAGQRVAIDLAAVEEILDCGVVTKLPQLPPMLAGVVDVRGRALPLLDPGAIRGDESPRTGRPMVIVTDGQRPLALLIDSVEQIIDEDDHSMAEQVTFLDLAGLLEGLRE